PGAEKPKQRGDSVGESGRPVRPGEPDEERERTADRSSSEERESAGDRPADRVAEPARREVDHPCRSAAPDLCERFGTLHLTVPPDDHNRTGDRQTHNSHLRNEWATF